MFVGIVNLRIFSSNILDGQEHGCFIWNFDCLKKEIETLKIFFQKFVILYSVEVFSFNLSVQFFSMTIELQCKITKKYRKQQGCLTGQKDKRKITAHYSQNTFDVVRNRFQGIWHFIRWPCFMFLLKVFFIFVLFTSTLDNHPWSISWNHRCTVAQRPEGENYIFQ